MIHNALSVIMVALVGSGAGYPPKNETDLTVAPWAIALENRGVKTTPAPDGGTYSVKKGKFIVANFSGLSVDRCRS